MCVCLSVFFGALFLLSIHLQGSHPSICRLPGPPYHLSSSLLHSSHPSLLSHTSLSRSFPYPTSSLSPTHGPILGITIPPCRRRRKKKKNMRARWVCPLPPSVLWIIFFMLLSVQNLYILLCALKTFKSSGEKENFRVTVTGFLSLTHTHTRARARIKTFSSC